MSAQALKTASLFSKENLPNPNAFNLHILRQVAHGSTGSMSPMNGHIYQAVIYGDRILGTKSASYDSGQAHSRSSYADKWESDGHMCQDSGFRWYWKLAGTAHRFRMLNEIVQGHYHHGEAMRAKYYLMEMSEEDFNNLMAHEQAQDLMLRAKAKLAFLKHTKRHSHTEWRAKKSIQRWARIPVYQVTFAD